MLDLLFVTIWNLASSGFNAEVDCVFFIDLRLDTNHLWANWKTFLEFILSITV